MHEATLSNFIRILSNISILDASIDILRCCASLDNCDVMAKYCFTHSLFRKLGLLILKVRRTLLDKKRIRTKYCCISKISNEVGRIDNFRALARKLSFLPNELDIFDIRKTLCTYSIYLSMSELLSFKHEFS